MIIVIGHVMTSPETAERMRQLSVTHCARSRAEPGCIAHNVHTDCEDPSRLVFVEYWTNLDALHVHFAVPESRAFVRELRALSPAPVEMKVFAAEDAPL